MEDTMSYTLSDLPIYKNRNFNTARNIFAPLAVLGGAAMAYVSYGDLAYATAASLVLPVVLVTAIGAIGTFVCLDYAATLRIDDHGFYYYGNMRSQVCAWDEIASVDTTRVLVSRSVMKTAVRITLKSDGSRKPKTLVFVYAFSVSADNLIDLLRECTAHFGHPDAVASPPPPLAVPAQTADAAPHFGKRQSSV